MLTITPTAAVEALREYRINCYSFAVTRTGRYQLIFNRAQDRKFVLIDPDTLYSYQFESVGEAARVAYLLGFPSLSLLDPVRLCCVVSCDDLGYGCPCVCQSARRVPVRLGGNRLLERIQSILGETSHV